ncbi:hypothetical protein [Mycobacterium sp. 1423905.2]|uniref:hypothetical protein n=1 Tax=Mycobacterium sp. 1423905.2 TaxID=1856859 RepID=UPI00080061FE|nr:hypothetical protein [Mycobacterium sp. 1423905.2]OBJ53409.1 hypothetical protein A9W95_18275 [Mycobacterium sp. 1423905.2]
MNDVGEGNEWTDIRKLWKEGAGYHGDEDGPDFSRPMTHPEMVQVYWETADYNPDMLADLYVNFYEFDQVEFMIFKDRLSAAILVANSTRQSVDKLKAQFEQEKTDGSHRVPGWEGESDMSLDEKLSIVENAQEISIGATMLTATAALESLLRDLTQDGGELRGGLNQLAKAFVLRHDATSDEEDKIMAMVSKVGKRRNAFAHTLTGSYWATEEPEFKFDVATMHDTLFTIGEIAIAIQALIDDR